MQSQPRIPRKVLAVLTFVVPHFVEWRAEDDVVLGWLSTERIEPHDENILRTFIVSFCTHDSCAAYATPPALGKLTKLSGPLGT